MYREHSLLARITAALLAALLLLPGALVPSTVSGATLYEQLADDAVAETYDQHEPGGATNNSPTQFLGKGLVGDAKSVVFKVNDPSLADNVAMGWYAIQLYLCNTTGYGSCYSVVENNATVQNTNEILVVFPVAHTFLEDHFYFLGNLSGGNGLGALFGSATDHFAGGDMNWTADTGTPTTDPDANVKDLTFRICDTAACDLTPTIPPDTTAPTLVIGTTMSSSTLPTITGTTDDAAAVEVTINSKTYATTLAGTTWSVTLPAGDELSEGTYPLTASSTDAAGNIGITSGDLVVDLTAPSIDLTSTTILGGIASTTNIHFAFTTNDPGASTLCAWDGAATSTCTSPTSAILSQGAHAFAVVATDTTGNSTTVVRNFTIDSIAPALLEGAPIATSTDTTPDYSFSSSEAGSLTFAGACSAATSSVSAGTTTLTFSALSVGSHADCSLSVTDAAGNTGVLSISAFTIEAVPPPPPPPASGGGGSNGPPVSNPSQGLPQSIVLGASTQAQQHAAPEAVAAIKAATPSIPALLPKSKKKDVAAPVAVTLTPSASPAPAATQKAVQTPWDLPASKQIPLAAAAAASGVSFNLPMALAAAVLIALFSALWLYRRRA